MSLLGRQKSLVVAFILLAAITINQTVVLNVKVNPGPAIVQGWPILKAKIINGQPISLFDESRYLNIEKGLRSLPIRFFVYEEPNELVQRQQLLWFRSGKHSDLLRARFGVDAHIEDEVLEALSTHSLRTMNKTHADLFIVPLRVGSAIIGRNNLEMDLLRSALKNTTFCTQPHVLVSLTTVGFNNRHMGHTRRHGMGERFYEAVAPLIVAQSWATHAAALVSQQGAAVGHDYEGMFSELDHALSMYGFSMGLLPQSDLPYYEATYEKFQNASHLIFYQTRIESSDWNSTRFRQILLDPHILNQLNWTNSSIGFGLPPDQWLRDLSSSKFCLAIRGDTPHTHSLLNAVRVGCIPVVVSDFYPIFAPSFPLTLNMEDYCIFIREADFIRDPVGEVLKLMDLNEDEIRRKLRGISFAQKVVVIDHPESLFVHAFLKESLSTYQNPPPPELIAYNTNFCPNSRS
jgi:hypothetical protein